jgi:leucyl-tRNA synthetase
MSKSLKNVVNPDDVVTRYGADSLRLYEMFMGPLDVMKPWDDRNVKGVFNFLSRVFRFVSNSENIVGETEDNEILRALHKTIRKTGDDIENLKFNTAISEMMIFLNLLYKKGRMTRDTALKFTLILSPFAPHLAEELWSLLGNNRSLAYEPWPEYNEAYLKEDSFEYPVSFNGKMRFKIELPADMSPDEVKNAVLSDERASKWTGPSGPANVIVVPGKIVNVVVK